MKTIGKLIVIISGITFAACSTNAVRVSDNSAASNNSAKLPEQSVIAHSNEPTGPGPAASVDPSKPKSKWTQSGTPIDTKKFDDAIKTADAAVKKSPKSADAKKALAKAYFDRGMALTDARQYPSALGDYRKALEADPEMAEAKQWVDQIIGIYASMNREAPKPGEEPPPLPFGDKEKEK
ncbi:MAG TPA: tetratricopeptide repeat protein [Pyrinomonadaceae bacterium]|nr:tetratricopeptide repeat protein [Pyrinomonadaceae bacterium]